MIYTNLGWSDLTYAVFSYKPNRQSRDAENYLLFTCTTLLWLLWCCMRSLLQNTCWQIAKVTKQSGTDYNSGWFILYQTIRCINFSKVVELKRNRKKALVSYIMMFKVFNNNFPTYLRERFHRTSEVHDCNYNFRGSNYDLKSLYNFLKRTFSQNRGTMAWKQLSNQTRALEDLTSFKLAIS